MWISKILSCDDASVANKELELENKRGLRWILLLLATLSLLFITYQRIKFALYILVTLIWSSEAKSKCEWHVTWVVWPRYVSSRLDGSTKGFLMGSQSWERKKKLQRNRCPVLCTQQACLSHRYLDKETLTLSSFWLTSLKNIFYETRVWFQQPFICLIYNNEQPHLWKMAWSTPFFILLLFVC